MARVDVSRYQTFSDITDRLDDIVTQVRDKDVSLERSLDLFDEAIALGSKAVSLVDATDFSPEEEARLVQEAEGAKKDAGEQGEKDADPDAAPDAPADGSDGQ
ncbi:exodeoxyribonuclease VII small subunit [Thermophilibacter provencensis]|uniref:Exodeoxyribonuclease VII small subunit n=1 Tax=Thermophilibacter provencensis TaxID=1852386 RepID=A0ABT7V466_9ACTN|nr:exodeoxyribonuclease VII small subunit [Thermophilibacter provencensis]MDM8271393.1 exodeoxyribonuclease VII small subunit [Thermophilibacter provencensis]